MRDLGTALREAPSSPGIRDSFGLLDAIALRYGSSLLRQGARRAFLEGLVSVLSGSMTARDNALSDY